MQGRVGRHVGATSLVVIAVWWIVNSHPGSGRVVFSVSRTHGFHSHDWFTLALLLGALELADSPLARRSRLRQRERTITRSMQSPSRIPTSSYSRTDALLGVVDAAQPTEFVGDVLEGRIVSGHVDDECVDIVV